MLCLREAAAPDDHMTQSPRSAPRPPVLVAATAVLALLLGLFLFRPGRSSGGVREWTPTDHDQPAEQAGQPKASKAAQPKGQPDGNLVEMAWARSCATCHGQVGRGDGPQGKLAKAPDLTRADWQDRVTDEQIIDKIRKGGNGMPASELPAAVLQGLVQRIRANRVKR
jgi:cytochrome c oxidase cbb3-type subunit 3